jgi:tetratricopeptide (TPR) repeat protein
MSETKDRTERTKRQLIDDARAAAMDGRWTEAITINEDLIDRFPRDAEPFNRKGRALLELNRFQEALDSYEEALRIDPANLIARRNLGRLDLLLQHPNGMPADGSGNESLPLPRPSVFLEEVGKTWHGELVNAAELVLLAEIDPGEQLTLIVEGPRLYVEDRGGRRLGEIEVGIAQRITQMIGEGNRYEIFSLGLSAQSLRVILREVYRAPQLGTRPSFPGKLKAVRQVDREGNLLRRDDDVLYADEEDEVDDDDETSADVADEIEPSDSDEPPIAITSYDVDDDDLNG